MEEWAEIRRLHKLEGMAIKAIARRLGVARNTVRTALAADEPPRYERRSRASMVGAFEPRIRTLLAEFPEMPATVIAERIGWENSSSVLRARVAELRPLYRPSDPADRTTYVAGDIVQCDLWFPGPVVPVAEDAPLADPPVLTMVSAFSGFIMALLLPSRTTGDLVAGVVGLRRDLLPDPTEWNRRWAPGTAGAPMSTTTADPARISGKDIAGEVVFLARELKAPVIAQTFTALGDQARDEHWSHEEYLAAVLGRQVASRAVNGTRMRISAARFPQIKTLEDFTLTHVPTATGDVIAHLATTTFVARQENVVLLGPPGIGKTHLAIALAIKAAEATYPVMFDSATNWITRLADAHANGRLAAELKRLNRYRVLVIDEVGYLPFDAASASLFFQLVASRYETGSIILTSNLSFSRWGETLGDDVVAAATIDRLVHHAHVIALDGDSYRTRAHRTANKTN